MKSKTARNILARTECLGLLLSSRSFGAFGNHAGPTESINRIF